MPSVPISNTSSSSSPPLSHSIPIEFHPFSWVPIFRRLTFDTQFIPLCPETIKALTIGSVYSSSTAVDTTNTTQQEWSDGTITTIESDDHDDQDDESQHQQQSIISSPYLSILSSRIESAISTLGGAISPKVSTTAPIDAVWMNFHRSTKCTTVDDVITLISSSERLLQMLQQQQLNSSSIKLALRKWDETIDIRHEWRLFIYQHQFIALCPRYQQQHSTVLSATTRNRLIDILTEWFYVKQIDEQFSSSSSSLSSYVIDVIVPTNSINTIKIIDFSPWNHPSTDPLCFQWSELEQSQYLHETGRPQLNSGSNNLSSSHSTSTTTQHQYVQPSQQMYDALPLELRQRDIVSDLATIAQRLVREHGDDDENVNGTGRN